jgi:hypothetical protein
MPCRAVAIDLLRKALIEATQPADESRQARASRRLNELIPSLTIPQIEGLEELIDIIAEQKEGAGNDPSKDK